MTAGLRIGIHSGQQHTTFEDSVAQWQLAEELGYDWASVFDHYIPISGSPEGAIYDSFSWLSAMAASTSRIKCGITVTNLLWRIPGVLAKIATTIDHISGGRLGLGLGAGAAGAEITQFDVPAGTLGERMDRLDETIQILRSLWTESPGPTAKASITASPTRLQSPSRSRIASPSGWVEWVSDGLCASLPSMQTAGMPSRHRWTSTSRSSRSWRTIAETWDETSPPSASRSSSRRCSAPMLTNWLSEQARRGSGPPLQASGFHHRRMRHGRARLNVSSTVCGPTSTLESGTFCCLRDRRPTPAPWSSLPTMWHPHSASTRSISRRPSE